MSRHGCRSRIGWDGKARSRFPRVASRSDFAFDGVVLPEYETITQRIAKTKEFSAQWPARRRERAFFPVGSVQGSMD